MSGERQHFIPQLLQDGFASHKVGNESYTWVYRKGKLPFNSNIINVGIERKFYTLENDVQLDNIITKLEGGSLSKLIKKLRISPPGYISDTQLPELIAHFEVRTRHIRQTLLQSFDYFSSKLTDFIADDDAFTDYLKRNIRKDPSMIHESMAKELAARGIPRQEIRKIIRKSLPIILSSIEQLRPILSVISAELRSTWQSKMKGTAKESHIKALKSSIAPPIRVQRYKELNYTVNEISEGNLILGDSIICFHIEGPKPFRSTLINDKDVLKAVFLPINPYRILIGATDLANVQNVNFRQAIARCSLEYFIASTDSNENKVISSMIGDDADIFSKDEIEKTFDEIFKL